MPTTVPPPPTSTPLSADELAAWRGLLQAHAQVTRALDAEMRAEHGLSLSSYEVLVSLADAPDRRLRMAEIADRVLLSRSGLTRLVDRLVARGHVARCAAEDDGRGAFAILTDAGAELLAAARRTHHDGVRRRFLDRLGPGDAAVLADIWAQVLDDAHGGSC